ncbi:ribonuclease H [Olea europaea subsp. europaea]|uniref:Ribonuclease H n=1 Tax=Olea europaea subsp. europaea TaxID=158383 RepID=A0A8S0UT67_OLEEU|nr:ribonuclease H [Olea europaea subsp. europaea]
MTSHKLIHSVMLISQGMWKWTVVVASLLPVHKPITQREAAELKALLTGLKICHERGYKNIWVELDTQLAVKRISDPATDSRPGRNRKVQYLVDEVRSISSYLNVHYTNIYRQANSAADFLANEGVRTKERRIMEEKELPEGLKEILRASGRLLGQ